MRTDVRRLCASFVFTTFGVNAERPFFVNVGAADGDSEWEDGNIHHDQVGNLDGGVEGGNVDSSKAGSTGRQRLEEAVQKLITRWECCYSRIVELTKLVATEQSEYGLTYIEDNEEDEIDAVEDDKNPK